MVLSLLDDTLRAEFHEDLDDLDVMVKAAQIYSLMALDICNRERKG